MDTVGIVGLDWASDPDEDLETFARMAYAGIPAALDGAGIPVSRVAERLLGRAVGEQRGVRIGAIVCGTHAAQHPCAVDTAQGLRLDLPGRIEDHGGPKAGFFAIDLQCPGPIVALDVGQDWLRRRLVDLVVVAGEDAVGSGALLLARASSVPPERIYALLESVVVGQAREGPEVCRQGLADAGVTPSHIGYLDVGTWPPPAEIVSGYRAGTEELSCAVGAVAALVGGPSPMGALINAALCIHRRQWVPTPATDSFDPQTAWQGTPFHTVTDARPWFLGSNSGRRRAAVFHADAFGTGHVVLAEVDSWRVPQPPRPWLADVTRILVPVAGATQDQLMIRLDALRRRLEEGEPLQPVARQAYADYERDAGRRNADYTVAIVGHDRDSVLQELQYAPDGIAAAFEKGRDWLTPGSSAFTAMPLGGQGIACVYPGAFNSYVGLGRDLFQHFPTLHEQLAILVSDPGRAVAESRLYPRSRARLSTDDLKARTLALTLDPPALIESGTVFAAAHTMILRDLFGVHAQAALGYSLGEASMLWAAGVWRDGDAGGAALRATPLFRTRICGPKDAVKEYWGLGPGEEVSWVSYLLKACVADVRRQLEEACPEGGRPRVYLTLINQPEEVVIAGDAEGCRRVIEALDCHALPIPYEVVIHSEAVRSEYEAFVDLYTYPVVERPPTRFYSAAGYDQLRLESAALADAMARMTCAPMDFPRLVERAYADGARVFVELGPLGTCTRRIKRILRGKPHVAVAINPGPGSDFDGVVGVLAQLLTHRVPLDLSPLYGGEDPMTVPLGLTDLGDRNVDERVRSDAYPDTVGTELWLDMYRRAFLPHRARMAGVQWAFLDGRREAQERARALIGLQMAVGSRLLPSYGGGWESGTDQSAPTNQQGTVVEVRTSVFDEDALREFAVGDVEQCFGSDFAVYRGRRLPRIPNGDLMMVSRIISIDAHPGIFTDGPSLTSAYDVPDDAWYYRGVPHRGLPPSVVLMEAGLQPCGFLSAYLRSPLLEPEADLYFRNLDGHGRVLADPDLRGKTVSNEVVLKSSVRGPGTILQSYAFALSCRGRRFYEGEATFGYFHREGLSRQAGLDLGPAAGDGPDPGAGFHAVRIPAGPGSATRRLRLLRDLVVVRDGGAHGLGALYGSGVVSPADWFFAAHFYQDAVMPGSLGVEAAVQALVAYARWRWPHFAGGSVWHPADHTVTWRYRGQITPEDRILSVGVHVSEVKETPAGVTLIGDASVWRGLRASECLSGRVRIYEIGGLAIRVGSG